MLGRTGLAVSRLGLGCSALGGVFGAVTESDAVDTVHAALEAGMNLFDVAPAYAATRSERILGAALAGRIARSSGRRSSRAGRRKVNRRPATPTGPPWTRDIDMGSGNGLRVILRRPASHSPGASPGRHDGRVAGRSRGGDGRRAKRVRSGPRGCGPRPLAEDLSACPTLA